MSFKRENKIEKDQMKVRFIRQLSSNRPSSAWPSMINRNQEFFASTVFLTHPALCWNNLYIREIIQPIHYFNKSIERFPVCPLLGIRVPISSKLVVNNPYLSSRQLLCSWTVPNYDFAMLHIYIYVEVSRNAHNGETNAKKLITRPIMTVTSPHITFTDTIFWPNLPPIMVKKCPMYWKWGCFLVRSKK